MGRKIMLVVIILAAVVAAALYLARDRFQPSASGVDEPSIPPAPEESLTPAEPSPSEKPVEEPAPPEPSDKADEESAGETEEESVDAGKAELLPVADTSIACYPIGARGADIKNSEHAVNMGGNERIKIKKHENHLLLKFDFSPVPPNAVIDKARLVLTMANGKALNHICVYSMHVDWNEGTGKWDESDPFQKEHDGACYLGPKGPHTRWREYEKSDFSHAALGSGGNATFLTRAEKLPGDKWAIDIDPYVIHAAIADGQTLGVTEETGHWGVEYTNAFVYSREAGPDNAPRLELSWGEKVDTTAPVFSGKLRVETGPFPGSLIIDLPQAGDDGAEGNAVGYSVEIDGTSLPQVQVPRPHRVHREFLATGLEEGKEVTVKVAAFDEAGNSAVTEAGGVTGTAWNRQLADAVPLQITLEPIEQPDGYTVRIVDGLTLYDPVSGGLSPHQIRSRQGTEEKDQRLQKAVKGDILGFQVLLTLNEEVDKIDSLTLGMSDFTGDAGTIDGSKAVFHREHYVPMKVRDKSVWIADILPIIKEGSSISIPSQGNIDGQKQAAVYVDLHIPTDTAPGVYRGRLKVSSPAGNASIPMAIRVFDVKLPDTLTFIVEMNAYGHPEKERFHAMYRLFHAHRLSYNVLPYGHSTTIKGGILATNGTGAGLRITDWSGYDELYGPILSGEVAEGLPRDGEPASHWYLPFHESWPVNLEETDPHQICWEGRVAPNTDKEKYQEWLDRCMLNDPLVPEHFSREWRDGNTAVIRQWIDHFVKKGWTQTKMQFFSNHKLYFASGSLSLWVMDEPQYGRDYRALDWLYAFYDRHASNGGMNYWLRADISRPGWMGDRMDEGLDQTVSSGSMEIQSEFVKRTAVASGANWWWYGGAGNADADPASATALFIRKWGLGCDGGLPNWLSVGGDKRWDRTDPLRYINFHPNTGEPVASYRMKAFREGQEMIELLNILSAKDGFNRWMVSDLAEKEFSVKIIMYRRNPDDPGYSTFEDLDYANLDALRDKVIATILQ